MKIPAEIRHHMEAVAQKTTAETKTAYIVNNTTVHSLQKKTRHILACHALLTDKWQWDSTIITTVGRTFIKMQFTRAGKHIYSLTYEETLPVSVNLWEFYQKDK